MSLTIREPQQNRREAAPLIEQELRRLYAPLDQQPYQVQRSSLNNLALSFFRTDYEVLFKAFEQGHCVLAGKLDPKRPGKYANSQLHISRWVRGPWEEMFGVAFIGYDPHWNDRIPPDMKKLIKKAASLPIESIAAMDLVDQMISCADGTYEEVVELAIHGGEDAGDYACWVVNAMRGPNMAAVVPVMMWLNDVPSGHVLKAYAEAHDKMGVRRRHIRDILGSTKFVTEFVCHVSGMNELEAMVQFLRTVPPAEATKLIARVVKNYDPILDRAFPGGAAAFLQRCVLSPNFNVRLALTRKRSGLFS
jgi:hypothetical protein